MGFPSVRQHTRRSTVISAVRRIWRTDDRDVSPESRRETSMRAGKLMAALFAIALLVAACGGGGDAESESSEAAGSEPAAGTEGGESSEGAGGAAGGDVRAAMVTDV